MMAEPSDLGGDYRTALWNYKTGEAHLDGVYAAERMDDDTVLILDTQRSPLGVLDAQGNVLGGFPAPARYYYGRAWNDRVVAYAVNPNEISDKADLKSS